MREGYEANNDYNYKRCEGKRMALGQGKPERKRSREIGSNRKKQSKHTTSQRQTQTHR